MSEYKGLIKLLFGSWSKTHELSTRIIDEQLRRNNLKRIEGNYRVSIDLLRNFKMKYSIPIKKLMKLILVLFDTTITKQKSNIEQYLL